MIANAPLNNTSIKSHDYNFFSSTGNRGLPWWSSG